MIITSSLPSVSTPSFFAELPAQDKIVHSLEYAGLGFLGLRSLRAIGYQFSRKTLLRAAGAGVLFAFLDELHQFPIPGRDASFLDFIADTLGLAIGMGVFLLVSRRQRPLVSNQQKGG